MNKPASELIALQAERAELMAKNAAATSWGAAVGARHERIKGIDGLLAANQSGSERAGVLNWYDINVRPSPKDRPIGLLSIQPQAAGGMHVTFDVCQWNTGVFEIGYGFKSGVGHGCATHWCEVADLRLPLATPPAQPAPEGGEPFQDRVRPWMLACFGPVIPFDKTERNHRFLEEAIELVQSLGCTQSEAHQLVDYVYGRPEGEPNQEVGGVMVTLAALCLANDIDMAAAGETELARIWTKVEKIRAKQAAKPKHSPLPEAPSTHGKPDGAVREKRGIYIASKTKHADRWRFLRDRIGEPIISTWIDEAGEGQSADLDDLWRRCLSEATGCQVLIAYREPGEIFKGGWVEIGAALAAGIPVYAVGLDGFTISKYQGITHFPDMKSAIAASRNVIAALHSPKIAAAETSPGDVLDVLRSIRAMCDEPLSYGRSNLADRIAAAIDRLDVKPESKSQEPVAWLYEVDMGHNYWSQRYADAKPVGNRWQRNFRPLYTHPTTKPEAPAVSVDAIKDLVRSFHRNSCYPEAGTGELNAVVNAIAALIAEGR